MIQQPVAPAPVDPLTGMPMAPQPPMIQPPMIQPPMIQPPMIQQPMIQQPMAQQQPAPGSGGTPMPAGGGEYGQSRGSGGTAGLRFVGQQLMFWSRIGVMTGIALLGIGILVALGARSFDTLKTAKTLTDIGQWVLAIAILVSLVGFGFLLTLPPSTGCWGLALAAFIVTAIGSLLAGITFLAADGGEVLILLATLTYFAGGVVTCILLRALANHYGQADAGGLAIGGLALNAAFGGLVLFFYILVKAGVQLNMDPDSGMAMVYIIIIAFTLIWIGAAALEMACLGKLGQHFRRG